MLLDILEAVELNIISGIKVGKVIDNETKETLLNEVSKKISEVAHLQSKEDIYIRLKKIKKIKEMKLLNRTNTWRIEGTYNFISKNICLTERGISNAINGKIDRTVIHEFIHSLQNKRISFKGKSIIHLKKRVVSSEQRDYRI